MERWIKTALALAACLLVCPGPTGVSSAAEDAAPGRYPERTGVDSKLDRVLRVPEFAVFSPFWPPMYAMERVRGMFSDSTDTEEEPGWFGREGEWGVYPHVVSRLGAGGGFFYRPWYPDSAAIDLRAAFGLRGRRYFSAGLTDMRLWPDGWRVDMLLEHMFLSDEDFFGIGPHSLQRDKSDYGLDLTKFELRAARRLARRGRLILAGKFESSRAGPGRDNDYPNTDLHFSGRGIPGLDRRVRMAGLRGELHWRTVNRIGNPTSGADYELYSGLYNSVGENDFRFWSARLNYSRYLHVYAGRVLVIEIDSRVSRPLNGGLIPFYHLSDIGREGTIHGYDRNRWRDRDRLIVSLTYRYPVMPLVDCEIFFDAGQVSPDIFRRVGLRSFQYGWGAGVRMWDDTGTQGTIRVGFSDEKKVRVYVDM